MCLAFVQSRRSLKDPWPVCLGVFFVSVFEQRAHVKAQTTRLAHDLDQISVVLQMWRRIVALRYIPLQMMSVYFSLYFNTRNGEAHQQFFAKHSCACVAVVFTSYLRNSYDSDQTLAFSLAQPDCLSSPFSSPPARLHYSAEEISGRTT